MAKYLHTTSEILMSDEHVNVKKDDSRCYSFKLHILLWIDYLAYLLRGVLEGARITRA